MFKPQYESLLEYPFTKHAAPIKLDQNESPEDFPTPLKERALQRIAALSWNRYPELHAEEVRAALARHEGWPEEGVVLSPGSNQLITALTAAARRVVDVTPSFALFESGARVAATPYRGIRLGDGFALPLDELLAAMDAPSGVLFLTNPHAPTGTLFAANAVARLAARARETGWLLVVDEAYHAFAGSDARDVARGNPNVALLRTFSKGWSLGSVRAGYLLASPEVAQVARAGVPPFGLSAQTAAVLLTALESPGYTGHHASRVRIERDRLFAALSKHPRWTPYPSTTNFILVRTPDARAACEHLLSRGVLVRRQDHVPGLEGCLRISVGTRAECDAVIEAAFGPPASGP